MRNWLKLKDIVQETTFLVNMDHIQAVYPHTENHKQSVLITSDPNQDAVIVGHSLEEIEALIRATRSASW